MTRPAGRGLLERLLPTPHAWATLARRTLWLGRLRGADPATVFAAIHRHRLFGGRQSVSGPGSSLPGTRTVRAALPGLLRELRVEVLLDIPCGDFHWMRHVELGETRYIGADIVPALVDDNRQRFADQRVSFQMLDIAADPLPSADLVLARDVFIHLTDDMVLAALANVHASGARWLLTTHFPGVRRNRPGRLGGFRPLNLERSPFALPPPRRLIADEDLYRAWGRCLGLWRTDDLPVDDGAVIRGTGPARSR
ncbi:MAG: class I SAM-dependent methyltransferase [Alphaproteobacteria bacterium]